jgi:hypothetical protein
MVIVIPRSRVVDAWFPVNDELVNVVPAATALNDPAVGSFHLEHEIEMVATNRTQRLLATPAGSGPLAQERPRTRRIERAIVGDGEQLDQLPMEQSDAIPIRGGRLGARRMGDDEGRRVRVVAGRINECQPSPSATPEWSAGQRRLDRRPL